MTTPELQHLSAFRAVAEHASFTRAAAELGMDKSRLSRMVSGLEREVGMVLFARTTRAVRLTTEGERLLARIGPHLSGLAEVFAAPRTAPSVAGHVVVTSTAELARMLLAAPVVAFRAAHPAITVELRTESTLTDLVRGGVDLALRAGHPGAPTLVARKVRSLTAGLYAAPSYLSRRGTPRSPEELEHHERLWPPKRAGRRSFASERRRARGGPTIAADDFDVVLALALAGGGIAVLPDHLASLAVREGRLVPVLVRARLAPTPLFVVCRAARPLPPRVRLLRDHLIAALSSLPR